MSRRTVRRERLKKIQARTERLEGKEFAIFYQSIQKSNENIRGCYLFCLYHGLRSQEAATLCWEYVDGQGIHLPCRNCKELEQRKQPAV